MPVERISGVHSDAGKPTGKKVQSNEALNITKARKVKLKSGI